MMTSESEVDAVMKYYNLKIVENYEYSDPLPVGDIALFNPFNPNREDGILIDGSSQIDGKTFMQRACQQPGLGGIKQAKYLLDNQFQIPEEWKRNILVFAGTVFEQRVSGRHYVPALLWWGFESKWILVISGIDDSSVFYAFARHRIVCR